MSHDNAANAHGDRATVVRDVENVQGGMSRPKLALSRRAELASPGKAEWARVEAEVVAVRGEVGRSK